MIEKIAVIGAGTMGHGIAESFALHRFDVHLYDVSEDVLKRALCFIAEELQLLADEDFIAPSMIAEMMGRIATFTDLAETVCDRDYVIEAIPEQIELKHALLRQLSALAPAHAILASNTSSLRLDAMASVLSPD